MLGAVLLQHHVHICPPGSSSWFWDILEPVWIQISWLLCEHKIRTKGGWYYGQIYQEAKWVISDSEQGTAFSKHIYFPQGQCLFPWTMLDRRTLPTLVVLIPIFIFWCRLPSLAATFFLVKYLYHTYPVWGLDFFLNLATFSICVDIFSQLSFLPPLPAYTVLSAQTRHALNRVSQTAPCKKLFL